MKIKSISNRLSENQRGMTTVEYAVAGALIGIAIVLAFSEMGNAVAAVISFLAAIFE